MYCHKIERKEPYSAREKDSCKSWRLLAIQVQALLSLVLLETGQLIDFHNYSFAPFIPFGKDHRSLKQREFARG